VQDWIWCLPGVKQARNDLSALGLEVLSYDYAKRGALQRQRDNRQIEIIQLRSTCRGIT
jgi:hypothetical protein